MASVFVDGGYLRELARAQSHGNLVDPRNLAAVLVDRQEVQTWAYHPSTGTNALLGRVMYYDAIPQAAASDPDTDAYWKAIELLPDVHLGFGELRGLRRNIRQKGVDTLMAVDMVVGAFSGLFDIAILVSGDADFVPVVEELRRRGVMVVVAAAKTSVSQELVRVADRHISIPSDYQWLRPMQADGRTFRA